MLKKIAKFLKKDALQKMSTIFNLLPGKPLEISLYYALQAVFDSMDLPVQPSMPVREAKEADQPALEQCVSKPARYQSRFRQGDRCLIALADGVVAGYLWFSVRDKYTEEQTGYDVVVPRDAVYSYDEYVSPEYRQQGVLNQLFAVLREVMKIEGRERILILIEHSNEISWKAHTKKGFVPLLSIVYTRILSKRFYFERCVPGGT